MKVTSTANFQLRRIHVVDQNDSGHLESRYYDFDDDRSMYTKWNELLKEIHYSMDMINQTISTATAFHR